MSDEIEAVIERLRNGPGGSLNVFDARPTSPTYPYVVVYADAGIRFSDRENDVRVRRTRGWQTTTVGVSASQAREALNRVTDALEDWTPVVPGRSCSKVEHELTRPVSKDDSLPDRVVFSATDQWSTVSDPT